MTDTSGAEDQDFDKWLWEWTRERRVNRETRITSFLDIADAAKRSGFELGWREMAVLETPARHEPGLGPTVELLEFLRAYLGSRDIELAVDPAMTSLALLMAVADGAATRKAVGFSPGDWMQVRSDHLPDAYPVDVQQGWLLPPNALDIAEIGNPDLIVSAPPLGMSPERVAYPTPNGDVELRDEAGLHTLLAARALSDGGEALFVVGGGFVGKHNGQVRLALEGFGLHVHAAVELVGAVRATGTRLTLLSLKKQPVDRVWVGEFSQHVNGEQLAQNMRGRVTGRVAELGRLVDWQGYTGFERLKATEEFEQLAKRTGIPLVELGDVLSDKPVWGRSGQDAGHVEPEPDVVYLPTFPTSEAKTGPAAAEMKTGGCVALPVDPSKVSARYLADVLNGSVGRAAREAASGGTIMRSLRRGETLKMRLPLPDLAHQQKIAALRERMTQVRSDIDRLAIDAIERPRDFADIQHEFAAVTEVDPIQSWVQSLPFPLASVAHRYRAAADPADKSQHLLHLFEATASFYCAVLLSAFDSDEGLLQDEKERWSAEGEVLDLTRPTFGTWTTLGPRLAKSARRLLADKHDEGALSLRMKDAFSLRSENFLELVTAKSLWVVLDAARKIRNDQAHGGIETAAQQTARLLDLESQLEQLRDLTWRAMREISLVRPGGGAYREGINQYERALDLTGPVDTFAVQPVNSTQQLEADALYLVDASQETTLGGLKLVPLLRLGPTPATEEAACYFYCRSEPGGELEYVSYHYREKPEMRLSDTALRECLARFDFAL